MRRSPSEYTRGPYWLARRPGRSYDICYYDAASGHTRTISTSTSDLSAAMIALDHHYVSRTDHRYCAHCGQLRPHDGSVTVAEAISDYVVARSSRRSPKSIRNRLAHILDFLESTGSQGIFPTALDQEWADRFRTWMRSRTYFRCPRSQTNPARYSESTIEGSLLQLKAALRLAKFPVGFSVIPQGLVSQTPLYRAPVEVIAQMFAYCLDPDRRCRVERRSLLRYLRLAVATWARPDALHEFSGRQFHAESSTLSLLVPGTTQTQKFRPDLPVPRQMIPHLTALAPDECYVPVYSVVFAWNSMARSLGLPRDGESGPKLIRRSVSQIARNRLGEDAWAACRRYLGHVRTTVSDRYALALPSQLGVPLACTETLIDEIEALAPGAFTAS